MKQKDYVALTCQERRLVIESLNRLRNRLISEGRYTDQYSKEEKAALAERKNRRHEGYRHRRFLA